MFPSHPNTVLLPRYLRFSTLRSPSLSSLTRTTLQMFGSSTSFPSRSKFHRRVIRSPSYLFSPVLLLQRASGFVLYSNNRVETPAGRLLLIQGRFTQVESQHKGRKEREESMMWKTERCRQLDEDLLECVDPGWTSLRLQ